MSKKSDTKKGEGISRPATVRRDGQSGTFITEKRGYQATHDHGTIKPPKGGTGESGTKK